MNRAPAPQSNFVTALAWTSIIVSGFGTLVTFFQTLLIHALFSDDIVRQLRTDGPDDPLAQAMADWVPRFPMLFGLMFVMSAVSLVASIGLLKRVEWARKLFIALLVLGIAWNIGALFLQQQMIAMMPTVPAEAGAPPVDAFIRVIRIVSGVMTVVLSVLLGWLAKKLMAPAIVAEFQR